MKLWLILPLAALLIMALLLVALQAWLESPSGRGSLQRALETASGMRVELGGTVSLSLFPSVGIEGEDLSLASPGAPHAFVEAGRYRLAVDAAALLRRQIVIDGLRLESGRLDAWAWRPGPETSAEAGGPARIPEVRLLELNDIRLRFSGPDEQGLLLSAFSLAGFAPGADAALALELRMAGYHWRTEGVLKTDPQWQSLRLDAHAEAGFPGLPDLELERLDLVVNPASGQLDLQTAGRMGPFSALSLQAAGNWLDPQRLALQLQAEREGQDGRLQLDINSATLHPPVFELTMDLAGDAVSGHACFDLASSALDLELAGESFDLDRLAAFASGLSSPGEQAPSQVNWPPDIGFPLAFRLSLGQAQLQGATATGLLIEAGPEPVCSLPEAPQEDMHPDGGR